MQTAKTHSVTVFEGGRYWYEIVQVAARTRVVFEIRAISYHSGRLSHINTLNPILSLFGLSEQDSRCGESDWLLSKKRAKQYQRLFAQALADGWFRGQLENVLDEDRQQSEWEAVRV